MAKTKYKSPGGSTGGKTFTGSPVAPSAFVKDSAPKMPASNMGGNVTKSPSPKFSNSANKGVDRPHGFLKSGPYPQPARGGPASVAPGNGKAAITAHPRSRMPKAK